MKQIAFVWANYGPYHLDRVEAVKDLLGDRYKIIGIQKTGHSGTYEWENVAEGRHFSLITLFPHSDKTPFLKTVFRLCRKLASAQTKYIFLCEYQIPHIFVCASILRLTGKRVFIMSDSKFDDKLRYLWREIGKVFLHLPYNGAFAAGRRSSEYLRFLGFGKRPIVEGYDTLSIERIRRNVCVSAAPGGTPFDQRHFTCIARFVPKKNLPMLINAYAEYRRMAGETVRELHLCGSGPDEKKIRAHVVQLGLKGVFFRGFLQEQAVANVLGTSLALVLPSFEEQWGLVINEALAMGLPILCGEGVGARDALVRTAINGYGVETDNPQGLAHLMLRLSEDEKEWQRMAQASLDLAMMGDASRFAQSVAKLIEAKPCETSHS